MWKTGHAYCTLCTHILHADAYSSFTFVHELNSNQKYICGLFYITKCIYMLYWIMATACVCKHFLDVELLNSCLARIFIQEKIWTYLTISYLAATAHRILENDHFDSILCRIKNEKLLFLANLVPQKPQWLDIVKGQANEKWKMLEF